MKKNKDVSIQLIRVIAMLMIIFDHILAYINIPLKSLILQLMNSGVFIFLFISGYLYGKKTISNWGKWFVGRVSRICIPMWSFMIIDFCVEYVIWKIFNVKYIFIYMFNMQGILGVTIGGAALWFLTLLMICYILTPVLQQIRESEKVIYVKYGIIVLIVLQIVFAYITSKGMTSGHSISWCILAVGIYCLGYFKGERLLPHKIENQILIKTMIVTCLSVIIVILAKKFLDGKIIYDKIIIYYGLIVIDYFLCLILKLLGQIIKNIKMVCVINHFDKLSYYVYIVHALVIVAITINCIPICGKWIYIILTLIVSYLCALLLEALSNVIYRIIEKKE